MICGDAPCCTLPGLGGGGSDETGCPGINGDPGMEVEVELGNGELRLKLVRCARSGASISNNWSVIPSSIGFFLLWQCQW